MSSLLLLILTRFEFHNIISSIPCPHTQTAVRRKWVIYDCMHRRRIHHQGSKRCAKSILDIILPLNDPELLLNFLYEARVSKKVIFRLTSLVTPQNTSVTMFRPFIWYTLKALPRDSLCVPVQIDAWMYKWVQHADFVRIMEVIPEEDYDRIANRMLSIASMQHSDYAPLLKVGGSVTSSTGRYRGNNALNDACKFGNITFVSGVIDRLSNETVYEALGLACQYNKTQLADYLKTVLRNRNNSFTLFKRRRMT